MLDSVHNSCIGLALQKQFSVFSGAYNLGSTWHGKMLRETDLEWKSYMQATSEIAGLAYCIC